VDSTPDKIVLETVMASCGMPYIFTPRKDQEGFCVIDGAVTEAARMPMLPTFDPDHTMGVLVLSNNRENTDYPCKYMIFLDCPRVKFTTLNVTPAMVNYLLKVGKDSIVSN
jgi:predicted acylesterase/phospholipase RssA